MPQALDKTADAKSAVIETAGRARKVVGHATIAPSTVEEHAYRSEAAVVELKGISGGVGFDIIFIFDAAGLPSFASPLRYAARFGSKSFL